MEALPKRVGLIGGLGILAHTEVNLRFVYIFTVESCGGDIGLRNRCHAEECDGVELTAHVERMFVNLVHA